MSQVPFRQELANRPPQVRRGQPNTGPDIVLHPNRNPIEQQILAQRDELKVRQVEITNRAIELRRKRTENPKTLDAVRSLKSLLTLDFPGIGPISPIPGADKVGVFAKGNEPELLAAEAEAQQITRETITILRELEVLETRAVIAAYIPGAVHSGDVSSMEDVISMGMGEPDFTTPWHIRETGSYALEKGYTM